MDYKCVSCVIEQWNMLKGSGKTYGDAADQADEAVVMANGTAFCAKHAVFANQAAGSRR